MKITLKRYEFRDTYTVGRLYIDDVYFCYTLEDKVREGEKVNGQTAIPTGTYNVIIDVSTRFGKQLPHILNVPNFTGVRIHAGNTSKDTEGCILLGQTYAGKDFIGNSKSAFDVFFEKLKQAKTATITIC
ncbi:hypothetical protein UFOVP89_61 [uncultured Caudovirales phage]|uniref:DUF5675 domain-containing protein n=1 Tax=uncultured Caudovirales phage TaxID=2100421 RepID=A0A6J5KZT6_9CAUD|nr:hypothetical protein UFOVP89_61 [uncultured Caudovirales phage]